MPARARTSAVFPVIHMAGQQQCSGFSMRPISGSARRLRLELRDLYRAHVQPKHDFFQCGRSPRQPPRCALIHRPTALQCDTIQRKAGQILFPARTCPRPAQWLSCTNNIKGQLPAPPQPVTRRFAALLKPQQAVLTKNRKHRDFF